MLVADARGDGGRVGMTRRGGGGGGGPELRTRTEAGRTSRRDAGDWRTTECYVVLCALTHSTNSSCSIMVAACGGGGVRR